MAIKKELEEKVRQLEAELNVTASTGPVDRKIVFKDGACKLVNKNLLIGKSPDRTGYVVLADIVTERVYEIDPSHWVIAVASVSVGGNSGENHDKVLRLHEGR